MAIFIRRPSILTLPSAGATYLGQVGTRAYLNDGSTSGAGHSSYMNRTYHFARDNITSLKVGWTNFYIDPTVGAETAAGSTVKLTASIEYPAGTFTQLSFSNQATGTIADGGYLISDLIDISIPRDAKFFLRMYQTNFTNLTWKADEGFFLKDVANGDAFNIDTADLTMSGTVTDGGGSFAGMYPALILAWTARPSVLILGEHRAQGIVDSYSDNAGFIGNLERSIGPVFGELNCASGNSTAAGFNASHTNRVAFGQYFTHLVSQLGWLDIRNDHDTDAQALSALQTLYALYPNLKKFQTTHEPETTSTDGWATTGNQTIADATANGFRTALNDTIRNVPAPLIGMFDIASAAESSLDSGIWKAPNYTPDGHHLSQAGNISVKNSGVVNTGLIT